MRYMQKVAIGIIFGLICNVQAGWDSPVALSSQYYDSLNARFVFNTDNTGFSLWPQATGLSISGTPFPTFLSQYNPNTASWTSLTDLTQLGQSNFGCADPKIKFDAQGNGLSVWARGNNELSNSSIVALSYINGSFLPMNNPEILSQAYAFAPQLAMAPDGDALVTWVVADIDTYECYIQAAYYKGITHDWVRGIDGGPLIKTIKDNIQFLDPYLPFPQLGMDEYHRALFVWAELSFDQVSTFSSTIFSVVYDGSDWSSWAPESPTRLSLLQGYNPVVAMNAAGDATVAFAGTSDTSYPETSPFTIQAVRYDAATQDYIRVAGSIVIKDLESDVYPLYFARPQVAIDPEGNSIITWDNWYTIKATRYPVTATWSGWEPYVSTLSQDLVMLPTVAMDVQGNATALWMVYVPPYGALVLEASAYDRAIDSWGSSSYVVTDFDHDIHFFLTQDDWPSIVYDANDNAFAMWCQSDGRVVRLNSARYVTGAVLRAVSFQQDQELDEKNFARRAEQARNHMDVQLEKSKASKSHKKYVNIGKKTAELTAIKEFYDF